MSASDLNRNNKENSKPKNNYKLFPQNKPVFIIIVVGLVAGIGVIFGYWYFEDQQNQLQSKLDVEQKKAQQLENQKKQEELKAQQVQAQLQQQAQQKQAELDQQQQQLQNQQVLQKGREDIAQFKQQQLQQQLQAQQQQAQQQQQQLQQQLQAQQQQAQQQQQEAQAQLQAQQQQAQIQQTRQTYITYAQSNAVISGLIKGYINFYIDPLPSYADPSIQQGVSNVINALDGHTEVGLPVHRVYDITQADIHISWIKNYGTSTLGETIFGKQIDVGLGNDPCGGLWQAFDSWTVEKILWHELGHSFGYAHSSDPNNIMYFETEVNHIGLLNYVCAEPKATFPNMQWDQNAWKMTPQEYTQIWNLFHNSP